MTITREQIEMYASAADATQTFEMDKGKLIAVEPEHMQELARIALASLEADVIGITDRSEIECLKRGEMANVMPPDYKGVDSGDEVYVYTAPPAPASVPDEVTEEDCPAFVKYDITEVDEAWASGFNACRAAMQGKADGTLTNEGTIPGGNSPVIPDGWVACSERMPEQGDYVSAVSRHGEYVSGQVVDDWIELHDGTSFSVDELYLWMPLPALPAAQQPSSPAAQQQESE